MLTGAIHNPNRYPELNNLVAELKRTHVCRYLLEVVSDGADTVKFIDERWPMHSAATLSMQDNKVFVIRSEVIHNDKYAYHNDDYHTRKTSNLAKMRRWLKEYVNPFSAAMIAHLSSNTADIVYRQWRDHYATDVWTAMRSFGTDAVVKDYVNFLDTGVPYSAPALSAITDPEFVAKYRTNIARMRTAMPETHVLVSPDEVVVITKKVDASRQEVVTCHYDQLISNIKEKVALLKMAPVNTFIEEVGVALNRCNFWVYE